MQIVAIFDFNGTLFGGRFFEAFLRYNFQYRIKRIQSIIFLATHIPIIIAYGAHLTTYKFMSKRWCDDLAWLVRGYEPEELDRIFTWIHEYFMEYLRPTVAAGLRRHQEQGHTTILISAVFSGILEKTGRELGFDYAAGTELKVKNNRCTGSIIKPSCQGKHKRERLMQLINEKGLDVDLASSYSYADTQMDIPILEIVGNPVATYPDKKLLVEAQKRGWRILK